MLRASSFIVETGTIDIQWRSSGSRPGYSLGRNVTATWTERNWWIIFDQTSRTPINQQIPTYKSTFPSLSLSLSKFSRFVFTHPFLALSFFFFSSPFFFRRFDLQEFRRNRQTSRVDGRSRRIVWRQSVTRASFSYYDELRSSRDERIIVHTYTHTYTRDRPPGAPNSQRWIMPTCIYIYTTRWRFVIRRDNRLQSSSFPVRPAYLNNT